MSESRQHHELVTNVIDYIRAKVGEDLFCLIESDAMDGHPLPELTLEGFRPDVFYEYQEVMYIGEAKTEKDIERQHSRKQYESYLKKCSIYPGKAEFILAIPFTRYTVASEIIRSLRKKYPGDYEIKIIPGHM